MKYKTLLTGLLLTAAIVSSGAVFRLYDSFEDPGNTGFTFIKQGTNFGVTWGALITPETPMENHIAGFRMWSYEYGSYSRADACYRFGEDLLIPFRFSWKAVNQNYWWVDSGKRKVALRAANQAVPEDVINSSSSNYQNLVEMYADGTVGGAWNRFDDGTGAGSYVTDPGGGVGPDPVPLSPHTFDLVVNPSATENFTYVVHSTERTLHPQRMDLFIDGQLATPEENLNGSPYEDKSGFDATLGFGTFAFTTATSGHAETDFVLDLIYIYTGDDVNDGTVAKEEPIDFLIATSYPWGANYYFHGLLQTYWGSGQNNWIYTRSGWCYVAYADASAFYVYLASRSEWTYIPAVSPNYVYLYLSGWHYWTPAGEFLPI